MTSQAVARAGGEQARPLAWSRAAVIGALVACAAVPLLAHQLDEYVGLTHVAISRDRVGLSVSLTPGAEIVGPVIAGIDHDGDGQLSLEEQRAYAVKILNKLSLRVDGTAAEIRLVSSSFPDVELLRLGRGVIQLEMEAAIPLLAAGRHVVSYANGNDDELSVYVVNALRPETAEISIESQTRDWRQTQADIEIVVRDVGQGDGPSGGVVAGLLVGAAALGGLGFVRRRASASRRS